MADTNKIITALTQIDSYLDKAVSLLNGLSQDAETGEAVLQAVDPSAAAKDDPKIQKFADKMASDAASVAQVENVIKAVIAVLQKQPQPAQKAIVNGYLVE